MFLDEFHLKMYIVFNRMFFDENDFLESDDLLSLQS